MEVCKLKPATKDYIWGGNRFKSWGKEANSEIISECWELSFHKDGLCFIDSGINKGKYLKDVVTADDLGSNVTKFPFFPVLIKLIDAKDDLSIQVHPSDEYALKNENSYGKTEMWYVLDATQDAKLYVGFKENMNKETVSKALNEGNLLSYLNAFNVHRGDCFMINSGTIHAIGKGVCLIEIQQNSNLTYRLFDYNRLGKDGKPRELHLEKALKVIDFNKYEISKGQDNCLGSCKYFTSYKMDSSIKKIEAPNTTFISFTVIDGNGKVNDIEAKLGDTFFVPANKSATLSGNFSFILTKV